MNEYIKKEIEGKISRCKVIRNYTLKIDRKEESIFIRQIRVRNQSFYADSASKNKDKI